MVLEDIQALPVGDIAAGDCCLFLWATWPLIHEAIHTVELWGFQYKTVAFVWVKTNKKAGTPFWGMGNWTRANTEICLLGIKGKPKRQSASVHSVISYPVIGQSGKPPIVRDRIVELCGDVSRIELFATERVAGWTSLGFGIDGRDIRESLKEIGHG
jgi:N6-adenosine-specific RNA methylase IME4